MQRARANSNQTSNIHWWWMKPNPKDKSLRFTSWLMNMCALRILLLLSLTHSLTHSLHEHFSGFLVFNFMKNIKIKITTKPQFRIGNNSTCCCCCFSTFVAQINATPNEICRSERMKRIRNEKQKTSEWVVLVLNILISTLTLSHQLFSIFILHHNYKFSILINEIHKRQFNDNKSY